MFDFEGVGGEDCLVATVFTLISGTEKDDAPLLVGGPTSHVGDGPSSRIASTREIPRCLASAESA